MPKIKRVEKQIWDIEDFDVVFRHPDGRDVRDDLAGIQSYSFVRKAKHSMSVAEWKTQRFRALYPQFEVDILRGDGRPAEGHTHVGTVRDSYFEPDELTADSEVEGEE